MITPRYYFSDDFKKYEKIFYSKAYKKVHFKKGECLCDINDNFDTMFYIIDGTVKLSILHESGHEKSVSFHGTGNLQPYYYPINFKLEKSLLLTAITDVNALAFDKNYFYTIIKENIDLYDSLLEGLVRLINLLMCENTSMLYDNGLVKISNFLYSYLKTGQSKNNIIYIQQHEIAAIAGMNRINTAKHLRELRNRKIISTARNKITILDEEDLFKLCSDEYKEKPATDILNDKREI